jgi:hypothetical protein
MAIGTYAQLQSAVADWAARADLSPRMADYITMAEARFNRELRVRQMETEATVTMTAGTGTLPTDFLAMKRVTYQGDPVRELYYQTPAYLQDAFPDTTASDPVVYTLEGLSLKVRPITSTSVKVLYWQKIPALSDSATTNWLLTAHPDLYLAATLAEVAQWEPDIPDAARYEARTVELIERVSRLSAQAPGQMQIRNVYRVP